MEFSVSEQIYSLNVLSEKQLKQKSCKKCGGWIKTEYSIRIPELFVYIFMFIFESLIEYSTGFYITKRIEREKNCIHYKYPACATKIL